MVLAYFKYVTFTYAKGPKAGKPGARITAGFDMPLPKMPRQRKPRYRRLWYNFWEPQGIPGLRHIQDVVGLRQAPKETLRNWVLRVESSLPRHVTVPLGADDKIDILGIPLFNEKGMSAAVEGLPGQQQSEDRK
jgi:hypothetical protein